jgi:hypothetical protein
MLTKAVSLSSFRLPARSVASGLRTRPGLLRTSAIIRIIRTLKKGGRAIAQGLGKRRSGESAYLQKRHQRLGAGSWPTGRPPSSGAVWRASGGLSGASSCGIRHVRAAMIRRFWRLASSRDLTRSCSSAISRSVRSPVVGSSEAPPSRGRIAPRPRVLYGDGAPADASAHGLGADTKDLGGFGHARTAFGRPSPTPHAEPSLGTHGCGTYPPSAGKMKSANFCFTAFYEVWLSTGPTPMSVPG